MGNEIPCFANSTPYDIKLSIYADRREELSRKETSSTNFTANATGAIGGEMKSNIGGTSTQAVKKVCADASFGYRGEVTAEYKTNYVDSDFSGFMTVNANTYVELKYLEDTSKTWYYSIVVLIDDNCVVKYAHNSMLPFQRMMLGFSKEGKFEFVQICKGKLWRASHMTGTQNYYGKVCPGCSNMIKCSKKCEEYANFKGH